MGYGIAVKEAGEVDLYRFGRSQQVFRGPRPSLKRPYIAVIGGSETFGKFVATPFPRLVQKRLQTTCVNWGTPGAGPGFFLKDPVLLEACSNASVCVIQVMQAEPLSNRMYSVFPRRNQRIRGVSEALKSLYPKTNFDQFKYVSGMLRHLREEDASTFKIVEAEMRAAWIARMLELIEDIHTKKVILWLRSDDTGTIVDQEMIDIVAGKVDQLVTVDITAGLHRGFGGGSKETQWMTRKVHDTVASKLVPTIQTVLNPKSDMVA